MLNLNLNLTQLARRGAELVRANASLLTESELRELILAAQRELSARYTVMESELAEYRVTEND
jgi:hypothetical protein